MKLTNKLLTLASVSTLALTGCFGEDEDTVGNSADLTIDGSNYAVTGTVSADEAFGVVYLTPQDENSPFDKSAIVVQSENPSSSLTLDGADSLYKLKEPCKGITYNFSVSVLTVDGAATMTSDEEPESKPVGTASVTATEGLNCDENGTPISSLEFSDTLSLGSFAASAPSWIDADDMTAHLNAAAKAISAKIDLMFVNEAGGGLFFMSPSIAAGQEHKSSTWSTANSTKFVKVDKDLASVLNQAELKALWSNTTTTKDQKTDALAVNDVVLLETDQGKIVAIKVIELNETATNDGKDTALVIGTLGDKAEVAEPAE
jgi:hypothetical protein